MANLQPYVALALHTLSMLLGFVSSVDLRIDSTFEERECHGTTNGMGYSGTLEMHYQRLKQRYTGCTYVNGNLEITNMWQAKDHDLSFLKDIRYVSGYVLFGVVSVENIPLDSLEVIRGNQTKELMNDHYSLIVAVTVDRFNISKGLKELHMPRLKEITHGKVLFTSNPFLGYVNTINWEPIMRGHPEDVHYLESAFDEGVASVNDTSICWDGSRWGDDPYLCQETMDDIQCHELCHGRCFGEGADECCHDTCAVGCVGPTNTDCYLCKDYVYEGACVGFCPHMTYTSMQSCVPYGNED
ncbi:epidermal growth factor receptor [Plakobranchus ocellatus]|uniref:receptor protein-tyrosine kinase n=1 Tax=Plakobranchus ocellatus TaxID=259542 RepID=A0AAV3YNR2_9GAST|nr:epidermal growth factor receptor [Plakobranchus ocellatus]